MNVQVGIAKSGARRLVAASITQSNNLGWHVYLYTLVGDKVSLLSGQIFATQDDAIADVCATLDIKPAELVTLPDHAVDAYLLRKLRANRRTT